MRRVITGEFYELPEGSATAHVPIAGTRGFADARAQALKKLGLAPTERFELTRTESAVSVTRHFYVTDGCPDG